MKRNSKSIKPNTKTSLITYIILIAAFVIVQIMLANGGMSYMMQDLLVPLCVYAILAVSLNLTVGILGELSLGQAGFMCIGAYSGALFSNLMAEAIPEAVIRFPLSLLLGGLCAAIFGILIGIPVLRLRGDYLAIVTLAFGEIIKNICASIYLGRDADGFHISLKSVSDMNMAADGEMFINGALGINGTPKDSNFIIAFIIVKVPLGQKLVTILSDGITAVISCGNEGLEFVFGDLFTGGSAGLYVFIVQSLGNIIFVSALVSALYYLGVIGFVVKWIGKAVGVVTRTSEVETFVAVANMFLGHTDSPILVAKYLPRLTDSEIFVILVSGMGSMSASILGGYSALGIPMSTLLIASALVPIGSIMVSKVMCPQTEEIEQVSEVKMDNKGNNTNVIDALSEGCNTGIQMVISIGASIVGFMGVMAIFDMILGIFGISLAQIFGYVFAPFGFLMGLEGSDILMEGTLLGQKLILNEFIAFGNLAPQLASLDARTGLVATISLCGFANISSMGMCIGGIGVLCPEKRGTISRLIVKATIAGVFVSINSALLVSIVSLF